MGVSGLSKYEGSLSISVQCAGGRVRDPEGTFSGHATDFNCHRDDIAAVGILHKNSARRKRDGSLRRTIICGLLMHSSLAVTTDGLPGANSDQVLEPGSVLWLQSTEEEDPSTRVPIEVKASYRWL